MSADSIILEKDGNVSCSANVEDGGNLQVSIAINRDPSHWERPAHCKTCDFS
jgi:hypothetical protein